MLRRDWSSDVCSSDLTPAEARLRIRALAEQALPGFRDGLLIETTQARFEARNLAAALETFIETVVRWMSQYAFDPAAVELGFGLDPDSLPAWELDLGSGHRLAFRGKIDRVDLWRDPSTESAACVVIDYKSSSRKIDPVLAEHGVQLQLPAYLTYLRALADPMRAFGIRRLVPAGVFFVNLRAESKPVKHRGEALSPGDGASAYQHAGRFNQEFLKLLDRRDAEAGDQFNYRLTKAGKVHGACRDPVQAAEFQQMLDRVEEHLRRMGREIFGGVVSIDPYRKGSGTACDRCDYQAICRIDPWTHSFRVLRANGAEGEGAGE
jgi:ATP-dependent helicase/nuclease subunit B